MNIWTNLLKRNSSLIITGDAEDLLNADHHLDRTFLQAIYNLKQLGHRVIIVSPDVQHAKRTAKFVRRASAAIAKSQAKERGRELFNENHPGTPEVSTAKSVSKLLTSFKAPADITFTPPASEHRKPQYPSIVELTPGSAAFNIFIKAAAKCDPTQKTSNLAHGFIDSTLALDGAECGLRPHIFRDLKTLAMGMPLSLQDEARLKVAMICMRIPNRESCKHYLKAALDRKKAPARLGNIVDELWVSLSVLPPEEREHIGMQGIACRVAHEFDVVCDVKDLKLGAYPEDLRNENLEALATYNNTMRENGETYDAALASIARIFSEAAHHKKAEKLYNKAQHELAFPEIWQGGDALTLRDIAQAVENLEPEDVNQCIAQAYLMSQTLA